MHPDSFGAPAEGRIATATSRRQITAWSFWDWGSAAFNAVIVTFVFTVYLTDAVGRDLPGTVGAETWLAWTLAISGLFVALLAPVMGQRSDAAGRRKRSLALLTTFVIVMMLGMTFVQADYHYLWLGLALLALGSIAFELSNVPYFAMLRQVSTPRTIGRVSGFGWAMGYFGGIILLLVVYFGFIAGDGDTRGLLGLTTEGGFNVRMAVLVSAIWFAVFALPLFLSIPELPPEPERAGHGKGVKAAYAKLFHDVRVLWREDPRTVKFLIVSAIFRDGLAGVFAFGAVLAVLVYGINEADVILFGVAANVLAGIGALIGGRLDDTIGPKIVIVVSLAAMIAAGIGLFLADGPAAFWFLGLILTIFVGPAQSASRTFLGRLTPPGKEGEMYGLYATTGRAASFLSPALFGLFSWLLDGARGGIIGLVLVLVVGLLALLAIPAPKGDRATDAVV
ncbi:MFS transporter [Hoyosella sp. G463]|uniref:MFS transporter n=1 Tax=Lolliginicoccus lacisalsi TaxID=2742202 RepID=A0A927JAW3_9ACTN|nr:MFS transporter [Lolliginicoccus lacisalsi]MBD8505726.1 MFS transporter [Lolliginicoccus lacisalsi]